ncbi:uncharacterized protein LOC123671377 isoform X2 [Harmonia axyridis]|uniref:uncharacterized protein LOC123671377 isoform X2 n=1 Tax=Harmonia axyridis TaxID=115357 RepID=UPI001E275C26|nr:uncharacterized protein LOC123671377 isoform X2 [Harmonia axyridis]
MILERVSFIISSAEHFFPVTRNDGSNSSISNNILPPEDFLGFTYEYCKKERNSKLIHIEGMETKMKMLMGIGGKTIASFANGKEAFIIDASFYICPGNYQTSNGNCDQQLIPMYLDVLEHLCFLKPMKSNQNYICLSAQYSVTLKENNNGAVICRSESQLGSPVLLSLRSFDKFCSEFGHGKFVYYPDKNRNDSVELPHRNPFVTCLNDHSTDFCKFTV